MNITISFIINNLMWAADLVIIIFLVVFKSFTATTNQILRKLACFVNRTEVYNDFPKENIYIGAMIRKLRSNMCVASKGVP